MITRICSKCGEEKNIDEFYKKCSGRNGYSAQCKVCTLNEQRDKRIKMKISHDYTITGTKFCSKCGEEKDLNEFNKCSRAKDGYEWNCRSCRSLQMQEYRNKNRDALNKYRREYYYKNIEYERLSRENFKLKNPTYYSDRYIANKERILNQQKEYYKNNKHLRKEYNLKNAQLIRERRRLYIKTERGRLNKHKNDHRRRDNLKQTECSLTIEQWNKILSNQGNKCAMCGKRFCKSRPATKDHIIPVSKGGGFTFENIQALCGSCNSSKNASLDHTKITTWIYA